MFDQAKMQSFVQSIQFNVLSIHLATRAVVYFAFQSCNPTSI